MRSSRRFGPGLVVAFAFIFALTVVAAQAMASHHARPDYPGWVRLNAQKSFITSAHPTAKDVYVNEVGAEAALTRSFPYPAGSELVRESIDPETLSVFVITAMRKVAGFDPANGDWQYAMFERGEDDMFNGMWAEVGSEMHTMCSTCYTRAADRDYTVLTYAWN